MIEWDVEFLPEALDDYDRLDKSQKILVDKAIRKVRINPLSKKDGGYGEPLGNKGGRNLTNYYKVVIKKSGIRIVYKVIKSKTSMKIVVIGARKDSDAYNIAVKRIAN